MEMGQDSKSTQISSLGGREGKKLEYRQGMKSPMTRMVDCDTLKLQSWCGVIDNGFEGVTRVVKVRYVKGFNQQTP